MTLVISSGHRTFDPLRNALCVLAQKRGFDIQAVWLVDNPETAPSFWENGEGIKATLGKEVMIASLEVNEGNAHDKIPAFMSQFVLRDPNATDTIVVDLTAGPKFIASLLYAAASFCRIKHIYYFLLKGDKRTVPFEDLVEGQDFEYVPLPGFTDESLFQLGRRSYLELILYLKEVEDLVNGYSQTAPSLSEKIDHYLRASVRNYFDDDYRGAIRSAGALLEMLAESLFRFLQDIGQVPRDSDDKKRKDWAYHTSAMRKFFRNLQYLQEGATLTDFDEPVLSMAVSVATVNDLLDAARPFRNLASHTANLRYLPTKRDAKLVIDIAFNVLSKAKGTPFFDEGERQV